MTWLALCLFYFKPSSGLAFRIAGAMASYLTPERSPQPRAAALHKDIHFCAWKLRIPASAIIERFSHIPGGLCTDVVRIGVYISRCQLLPMKVSLYAAPGSIISKTLILRFRIMP